MANKVLSQEYFQQEVNYWINVKLDDSGHTLGAFEKIEYINNSPDTLGFIYFHLWPNAYSNNSTALAKQISDLRGRQSVFDNPDLRGFIDSLDFIVDGNKVKWMFLLDSLDICKVLLNVPLPPGDTINICTPFYVKIPGGAISRFGHIGQSYQISQWYPKPAVYDKSGWHPMPYLEQGEYYSEYGNYEVNITLPVNYTVGATGELKNSGEIARLEKLANDSSWLKKSRRLDDNFPAISGELKTLHYTQDNVHDFAWFADKRYHVLKDKIRLPATGKEVTTMVLFTDFQSELWGKAIDYVNSSIISFSNWIGDFPYNTFTAVQGPIASGSGMEYPCVTIIGPADNAYSLEEVIIHEVCHSWFYSAIGSNERRYPFMDEGITTAYEIRYMEEKHQEKKLWDEYFKTLARAKFMHIENMPVHRIEEFQWLITARNNLEQPADDPAQEYSAMNYTSIIYNKVGLGFNYLRAYLGDTIFDKAMQAYYTEWANAHPAPGDLGCALESYTGKDLSWFFADFISTTKRIDYKMLSLHEYELSIRNKGEIESPFMIAGFKGDSLCFEKWIEGFKGKENINLPDGNYSDVIIDPYNIMPEIARINNNISRSKLFKRADTILLQPLFTIENPAKRSLIYIPGVNWSTTDGLMTGITFYNGIIFPKPFEYVIMPFYSFKRSEFVGYGRFTYNILPYNDPFRKISLIFETARFGAPGNNNFMKMVAGIDLHFKNRLSDNTVNHIISGRYIRASDLFNIDLPEKSHMLSFIQLDYIYKKNRAVNPWRFVASVESGGAHIKTFFDFKYKYNYVGKRNGFDVRLFTGIMLRDKSPVPFYKFAPSGRSGRETYLYQGSFLDRFDQSTQNVSSRMMLLSEGGLVSHVNDSLGYSNWLFSISVTSDLLGRDRQMPFKPFINVLVNDHTNEANELPLFFEAGLKVGYWDFFEIYIPLLVSANIKSISGTMKERIRFVLDLNYLFTLNLNHRL